MRWKTGEKMWPGKQIKVDWILRPYSGANQLEFGMLPDAVLKILGAPQTVQKRPNSVVNEFRGVAIPMVRYTSNAMNQLVFGPRVGRVFLDGMDHHAAAPAAFLAHVKKQDRDLWRSPGGGIISLKLAGYDLPVRRFADLLSISRGLKQ